MDTARRLLAAASVLAAMLLLPAAVAAAEPVVLSAGHVDALDVGLVDGELDVAVNDDTVEPSVLRDPADVIFHAAPGSKLQIPEGMPPEYAFLGAPGDPIWILPQVQDSALLWPGWETERIPAGALVGDGVDFRLLEVDGPGSLHVYVEGAFGNPAIIFDATDGLPDALRVPAHTHAHANWAFGAAGLYTLWFEVTGTLPGGRAVTSGPIRYRFFVGDLADLPDLPETDVTVGGLQPSYRAGDEVALTAVQQPDTGLTAFAWSARCGSGPFGPAGEGATLRFRAAIERDGCEYRATLRGAGGAFIARSAPVRLAVTAPPRPALAPVGSPPRVVGPPSRLRRPSLRGQRASLRGRALRVTMTLGTRSSVRIQVRRQGRTVFRSPARVLAAGRSSVRLRLPRKLAPGRYRIRIRARAQGRLLSRAIPLRVR